MIFAEKKKQSTGILPTENQVWAILKREIHTRSRNITPVRSPVKNDDQVE
jgi:hypothetical protein